MIEKSEKELLSWVESSKFKNRSCGYLNKLSETKSVIFLLVTQEKQVHNIVGAAVCVNYYYSLTFVSCTVLTSSGSQSSLTVGHATFQPFPLCATSQLCLYPCLQSCYLTNQSRYYSYVLLSLIASHSDPFCHQDPKSSPLLPPDLLKSLAALEEEEELIFSNPPDLYPALLGPLASLPGRSLFVCI